MPDTTTTAPGALLAEAADALRRAVSEEPLAAAERAYLASTASRLAAMSAAIREGQPAAAREGVEADGQELLDVELPKPPRRMLSRKEAAAVVGCHPNSLLLWEQRGLLQVRRDHRGWRVYGREELARAMALAAHIPLG